jgi:hypothetical protein
MNSGPAWIIFEESYREGTGVLLSILSPRRSVREIALLVEQFHIDRTASLRERLNYKKSRRAAAYEPTIDGHTIHCGHEPYLVAIYAKQTRITDAGLEIHYRISANRSTNPLDITFEDRSFTLAHSDA